LMESLKRKKRRKRNEDNIRSFIYSFRWLRL
jgi:hypothetical protein